MKKLLLYCLFLWCLNNLAHQNLEPLFDLQTLKNKDLVQKILITNGFEKIYITTQDNIKICALFLDKSKQNKDIKGTIICCAGFYPGTKEGISTFYALLADQPYNFLFFDARGHNESEGSLFSYNALKQYGQHEYLDIVAIVKFLDQYNNANNIDHKIFIHGICSGAFHAINALNFLETTNCPECKNIKGIIFDSGWLSLDQIVKPTLIAEIHKTLKSSWFSCLTKPLTYIIVSFYKVTFQKYYQKVKRIDDIITKIHCPIFFIHCKNDAYVPIDPIIKLTKKLPNAYTWWINYDSHADYHRQERNLYAQKLINFIKCC